MGTLLAVTHGSTSRSLHTLVKTAHSAVPGSKVQRTKSQHCVLCPIVCLAQWGERTFQPDEELCWASTGNSFGNGSGGSPSSRHWRKASTRGKHMLLAALACKRRVCLAGHNAGARPSGHWAALQACSCPTACSRAAEPLQPHLQSHHRQERPQHCSHKHADPGATHRPIPTSCPSYQEIDAAPLCLRTVIALHGAVTRSTVTLACSRPLSESSFLSRTS